MIKNRLIEIFQSWNRDSRE